MTCHIGTDILIRRIFLLTASIADGRGGHAFHVSKNLLYAPKTAGTERPRSTERIGGPGASLWPVRTIRGSRRSRQACPTTAERMGGRPARSRRPAPPLPVCRLLYPVRRPHRSLRPAPRAVARRPLRRWSG